MGSKISVQIERALLGKSSNVGISALGIDSGRMTSKPEVTELLPVCRQPRSYRTGGRRQKLAQEKLHLPL